MTNVVSDLIWEASMQLKVIYRLTVCVLRKRFSRRRVAGVQFAVTATEFVEGAEGEIRTIPFLDAIPLFFSLQSSIEMLRLQ